MVGQTCLCGHGFRGLPVGGGREGTPHLLLIKFAICKFSLIWMIHCWPFCSERQYYNVARPMCPCATGSFACSTRFFDIAPTLEFLKKNMLKHDRLQQLFAKEGWVRGWMGRCCKAKPGAGRDLLLFQGSAPRDLWGWDGHTSMNLTVYQNKTQILGRVRCRKGASCCARDHQLGLGGLWKTDLTDLANKDKKGKL